MGVKNSKTLQAGIDSWDLRIMCKTFWQIQIEHGKVEFSVRHRQIKEHFGITNERSVLVDRKPLIPIFSRYMQDAEPKVTR